MKNGQVFQKSANTGCLPALTVVAIVALIAWAVFDLPVKSAIAWGIGIALAPVAILLGIALLLLLIGLALIGISKVGLAVTGARK